MESLIENTVTSFPSVHWRQKDSGGFITAWKGVWIHLQREQNTTGSRLFLALFSGFHTVYISEPRRRALLGGFSSEEDRQLTEAMHKLEHAVAVQCLRQQSAAAEGDEPLRTMVFRQLLCDEHKT